jgi:hypothetical protein
MISPQPIRLTRRGELLRAVSHAIRCLTQVPAGDVTAWHTDTRHFRESIHSSYADVIQDIPDEFESWTSAAAGFPADHQAAVEFLERLSYEIQRETSNHPPELTAVGAVRSAAAVHVAGRRWPSFFR